jgi:arylsulfatase A-like enzyme
VSRADAPRFSIPTAALAALLAVGCTPHRSGPERVVLIVVDALRRDHVSAYGSANPTPHIDALAERGLAVADMTASFHQTSMSMGALFTGRTPSIESGDRREPLAWNGANWCGLARFAKPDDRSRCIPDALPTLPVRLREAGYWTIGVASNQFLFEPSGFGRGFDDFLEVRERETGAEPWTTRTWPLIQTAAEGALARRESDRFFLYVHYMDAHDYVYRGVPYTRGVREADEGVGALLAHLAAEKLLEETVVVLTSDHGEMLGEGYPPGRSRKRRLHWGNPSFQPVLQVPLIVAPAPAFAIAPMPRTQDLYGLVLRIAHIESEPTRELEADELLLGELSYQTYRKGRYKASFPRQRGWPVLFDLEADPLEQRNVAALHPELLKSLRRRVDALSASFAAPVSAAREDELTADDRARLEALGYLEPGSR